MERPRIMLDKRRYGRVALIDLEKPFDTAKYDLLMAKVHGY